MCVCAGFENQRQRQGTEEKKFEEALGEKAEERERLRQKLEDMERYVQRKEQRDKEREAN